MNNKRLFIIVLLSFAMDTFASELTLSQQNRYSSMLREYRCVVCQNQSLAESDNAISEALRLKIKTLILENKTNQQIDRYLKDRYGDFVSYKPPFTLQTFLLWLLPMLFMGYGLRLLLKR